MREIKFRGKAKSNGQWVYGNLSYREADDGHFCVYIEDQGWDGGLTEVDPESVGQYTGLKDKNGVEIYVGDVLMRDGGVLQFDVYIKNGAVGLTNFWGVFVPLAGDNNTFLQAGTDSRYAITGNIHDKKE